MSVGLRQTVLRIQFLVKLSGIWNWRGWVFLREKYDSNVKRFMWRRVKFNYGVYCLKSSLHYSLCLLSPTVQLIFPLISTSARTRGCVGVYTNTSQVSVSLQCLCVLTWNWSISHLLYRRLPLLLSNLLYDPAAVVCFKREVVGEEESSVTDDGLTKPQVFPECWVITPFLGRWHSLFFSLPDCLRVC